VKPDATPPNKAEAEAKPSFKLVAEGGPAGPVTRTVAGTGSMKVAEVSGMIVTVSYKVVGEALSTTLECQPWAIAAVNGISVGKTPVALPELKDHPVKVELRRPGSPQITLQISAKKAR